MFKDFIIQEIPYFFNLSKEEQNKKIKENKQLLIESFDLFFLKKISLDPNLENYLELQKLLQCNDKNGLKEFHSNISHKYNNLYNEAFLNFEGIGDNLFYLNEFVNIKEENINNIYEYIDYLFQNKIKYAKDSVKLFELNGEWIQFLWNTNDSSKFYYGTVYSIGSYLRLLLEDLYSDYLSKFFDISYVTKSGLNNKFKYYGKYKEIKFFQDQCEHYLNNYIQNFNIPENIKNSVFIIDHSNKVDNCMDIIINDFDVTHKIKFETFQNDIEKLLNCNIHILKEIEKKELSQFKQYMNLIYQKSLRLI